MDVLLTKCSASVAPQPQTVRIHVNAQRPDLLVILPAATASSTITDHTSSSVDERRRPSRTEPGTRAANGLIRVYPPSKWDIWMLGITIVIGGQYFSWNAGLAAGLYSYLIAYFLVASAYITLCCCTSEITGALPFTGGAYGLSRCTLGFFPGFIIGCCEALEYIAYVAASVVSLTQMIIQAAPILAGLEPAIALVFYLSALCLHIRGDRAFWVSNVVIGSLSLAIVLLFCVGALPYVNFAKYAAADPNLHFVNGVAGFMKVLPLAAWFFVGVEALSLASDQVTQPNITIPFAQIACVLTLFVTGVVVFFVSVSLPPGIAALPTELVPFNNCFEPLFRISCSTATILSIPATYATAFGFMWCYGKLIAAMAQSRLLPPILATKSGTARYVGISAGSLVSYSVCLLVHFVPDVEDYMVTICLTSAFLSYFGQCVGYISLKRKYKNIKSSSFTNPFGMGGAMYSMMFWALGLVAIAAFQGNGGVEIGTFVAVIALLTTYYFGYARKHQTFSDEENRILLVAHVMKFNASRSHPSRKASRVP
ncbi:putative transporter, partial [Globisporangium splendens]